MSAFFRLFEQEPTLFDQHEPTEIPFLPAVLPDRPLTSADLDWRPLLPLPVEGFEPFQATEDQLEPLRKLARPPGLVCEYDCVLVPNGAILEQGRPCFGRYGMLVECGQGMILGLDVQPGGIAPGQAAGRALVKALLTARMLPEELRIGGWRLQPALQPLCDALGIRLLPRPSLPVLDEALEALAAQMP